jgi:predicted Zn-dependent protease
VEADHIGLLLMASAGYDPLVAPKVFKKIGRSDGEHKNHPSGLQRAILLSNSKVMEEAHAMYEEVKAGRDVRTFI